LVILVDQQVFIVVLEFSAVTWNPNQRRHYERRRKWRKLTPFVAVGVATVEGYHYITMNNKAFTVFRQECRATKSSNSPRAKCPDECYGVVGILNSHAKKKELVN